MLKSLINQIRLTWRLMRDPRVPFWAKAIPILPFIYLISPLDIIPDILPIIGQLDDLTLIIAGMRAFEAATPDYIVQEHRTAIENGERGANDVIEGQARPVNRK